MSVRHKNSSYTYQHDWRKLANNVHINFDHTTIKCVTDFWDMHYILLLLKKVFLFSNLWLCNWFLSSVLYILVLPILFIVITEWWSLCVHLCLFVYVYLYVYVSICACVHSYLNLCGSGCVCTCMCTSMCLCVYVCVCVCMCVCNVCVCMCVHVCVGLLHFTVCSQEYLLHTTVGLGLFAPHT